MEWFKTICMIPAGARSIKGLALLSAFQFPCSPADLMATPCITLGKYWVIDADLPMPYRAPWWAGIPLMLFYSLAVWHCLSVCTFLLAHFLVWNSTSKFTVLDLKIKLVFLQVAPWKNWRSSVGGHYLNTLADDLHNMKCSLISFKCDRKGGGLALLRSIPSSTVTWNNYFFLPIVFFFSIVLYYTYIFHWLLQVLINSICKQLEDDLVRCIQ